MPRVSIITICKKDADISAFIDTINRQTFRDFELIVANDEKIPDAWNSAIDRAQGQVLVFTETDCVPTNTWLEELVSEVEEGKIVRGIEVIPAPLDPGNIAITRSTLNGNRFDRRFLPADDTEWFARLMSQGIELKQIQKAITFHNKRRQVARSLKWAFLYGENWSRIYQRYGAVYRSWHHTVGHNTIVIIEDMLHWLGAIYGLIRYLPERRFRKQLDNVSTVAQQSDPQHS